MRGGCRVGGVSLGIGIGSLRLNELVKLEDSIHDIGFFYHSACLGLNISSIDIGSCGWVPIGVLVVHLFTISEGPILSTITLEGSGHIEDCG